MSIIERSNPINLEYRVCVVKSASAPLGVVISKILLKANAFVIGIDSRQKDETLNAGLGTHFQFLQKEVSDEAVPNDIVQLSKKAFGKENVTALVNIVEEGEEKDLDKVKVLTEALAKNMQEGLGGCIINVSDADEEQTKSQSIIDFTKNIHSQFKDKRIRCNVIVPEANGQAPESTSKAYKDAISNMKEIMTSQRDTKGAQKEPPGATKHYDIGNLTLFLAGDMSENISGATVGLDGSYQ